MQDKSVRVRWFTFDIPQIVTIVSVFISLSGMYYQMDNRLNAMETFRDLRTKDTDSKFASIQSSQATINMKLERLPQTEQRLTTVETQLNETNKRLDRFAELLTNNIELIRRDLSIVATKVEVNSALTSTLSEKLDRVLNNRRASLELTTPSKTN